jgi:hypothetical protein
VGLNQLEKLAGISIIGVMVRWLNPAANPRCVPVAGFEKNCYMENGNPSFKVKRIVIISKEFC